MGKLGFPMPLPVGGPDPQAGIGETRFSHPLRMREGLGRRSPHVDAGRFATRLSAWYNRVARAGRIVWSSARHWKCRTAATLSRVRIPPCPPVLELLLSRQSPSRLSCTPTGGKSLLPGRALPSQTLPPGENLGKPGFPIPCSRAAPSQTLLRAGVWGNLVPPCSR